MTGGTKAVPNHVLGMSERASGEADSSTNAGRIDVSGENNPNYRGGKLSKTCPTCEEQFETYPSVDKTYCCVECYNESGRLTTDCKQCGESFTKKAHEDTSHCSRECAYKTAGEKQIVERVELICDECGDAFQVLPHKADDRQFCSSECSYENGRIDRVELECDWCEGEFKLPPGTLDHNTSRFCSRECWRKWCCEYRNGEDHPNWRGGSVGYYGSNWLKQRRRARERDNHRCQACGVDEVELDKELDVHHIKPIRTYDVLEEANELGNLVSLCRTCHQKYEGIPLRPQVIDSVS